MSKTTTTRPSDHPPDCPAYYTPMHVPMYMRPYCICTRPWCEWCGTSHDDPLITAECQRLREDCDGFTRE